MGQSPTLVIIVIIVVLVVVIVAVVFALVVGAGWRNLEPGRNEPRMRMSSEHQDGREGESRKYKVVFCRAYPEVRNFW